MSPPQITNSSLAVIFSLVNSTPVQKHGFPIPVCMTTFTAGTEMDPSRPSFQVISSSSVSGLRKCRRWIFRLKSLTGRSLFFESVIRISIRGTTQVSSPWKYFQTTMQNRQKNSRRTILDIRSFLVGMIIWLFRCRKNGVQQRGWRGWSAIRLEHIKRVRSLCCRRPVECGSECENICARSRTLTASYTVGVLELESYWFSPFWMQFSEREETYVLQYSVGMRHQDSGSLHCEQNLEIVRKWLIDSDSNWFVTRSIERSLPTS